MGRNPMVLILFHPAILSVLAVLGFDPGASGARRWGPALGSINMPDWPPRPPEIPRRIKEKNSLRDAP
jgi:hypothetical protein